MTEQFASLGHHIKKCQMTEFKEDCLSRETLRKCLNDLKIFISGDSILLLKLFNFKIFSSWTFRAHKDRVLRECSCSPVNMISYYGDQLKLCSPAQLDCVADLTLEEECEEHCEGPIMDVSKSSSVKNEEYLEEFISDYETYKFSYNVSFPAHMKSKLRTFCYSN